MYITDMSAFYVLTGQVTYRMAVGTQSLFIFDNHLMLVQNTRVRLIIAWLLGLATFFTLIFAVAKATEIYSLQTEYFDSHSHATNKTWTGWFLDAICLYFAIRVGFAAFHGSPKIGFTRNQNLGWQLILAFFGWFAVTIQWFASAYGNYFDHYLEPFFGLLIMYCYAALLAFACHFSFNRLKDAEQVDSFKKIRGSDENHWLEKIDGVYLYHYDNQKDFRTWKFKSRRRVSDEQVITEFKLYTGTGQSGHLFFDWLKKKKFIIEGPY